MREIFKEDGVSEVVDSMLILTLAVIVFLIVSAVVIHDFTSQNSPQHFSGFAVNSASVVKSPRTSEAYLLLNLSYSGQPLQVFNTTLIVIAGGDVFYVPFTDNDFSGSHQWYPAGPIMSGDYLLFNSSLSTTIPTSMHFDTSALAYSIMNQGRLLWSNGIFYSTPVITGLVSSPVNIYPNESVSFDFYIYSSYQVVQHKVSYLIVDSSNGTVISSGSALPVNITLSNEWYFPSSSVGRISFPYKGEYYVTITAFYHPPYSGESSISESFTVNVR
jgi:hypothetical protein